MIGKSAAVMRRSSWATRSRSSATGFCRYCSVTRMTCSFTSARPGQRFDARADIHEPDVDREHPAVQVPRVRRLPLLLERAAQPVQDTQPLLITGGGQVEGAPQDGFGDAERAFVVEADAQRLRRPQLAFRRPQRLLEFGNRL